MNHDLPPDAWRCARCGTAAWRCHSEPTCHPDDGAALVSRLGDRPSDTEPPDRPPVRDAFFDLTSAEPYLALARGPLAGEG